MIKSVEVDLNKTWVNGVDGAEVNAATADLLNDQGVWNAFFVQDIAHGDHHIAQDLVVTNNLINSKRTN